MSWKHTYSDEGVDPPSIEFRSPYPRRSPLLPTIPEPPLFEGFDDEHGDISHHTNRDDLSDSDCDSLIPLDSARSHPGSGRRCPITRIKSHTSRKSQTPSRTFGENEDTDVEKEDIPTQDYSVDSGETDTNLVDWIGPNDPDNPMNWPYLRKWRVTVLLGLTTLCVTFASTIFSTAIVATAKEFHVSEEVTVLGVSLFVVGFIFGPPVFGPLSELYGRKPPLFVGFFIFAVFQIPVAVAQDLYTLMICRFFGGLFGSAPLAIVGGTLTDFWGPVDRGVAMTVFSAATFIGPVAGPIAGGFIVESHIGWRWTEYITAIMAFFIWALGLFFVPESYAPTILQARAKRLRFKTKNWAIRSSQDEVHVDFKSILNKYLIRPFTMLVTEPILTLVTLYMSLIFGILYLFFEAYPIAFQEVRGWSPGIGALPFISISVGVIIGGAIIVYTSKKRFARKLQQHGKVVPEERLIPMIIGGFLFPTGLFWFSWTSSPHVSWVPQVMAGIPIGAGVLMIFLQGLNYIIDVYLLYANSAVAANTFVRSSFGAGFPLFAAPMFKNLGVDWAGTVLAFLTAVLFPVPILFYFYGARIRKASRWSVAGK